MYQHLDGIFQDYLTFIRSSWKNKIFLLNLSLIKPKQVF
jgi:hypothetical protein